MNAPTTYLPDEVLAKLVEDQKAAEAAIEEQAVASKTYKGQIRCRFTKGSAIIEILDETDWRLFKELVQRGSNLWPDAPPQIKEFADIVTNGKVMQDYYAQAGVINQSLNTLEK